MEYYHCDWVHFFHREHLSLIKKYDSFRTKKTNISSEVCELSRSWLAYAYVQLPIAGLAIYMRQRSGYAQFEFTDDRFYRGGVYNATPQKIL